MGASAGCAFLEVLTVRFIQTVNRKARRVAKERKDWADDGVDLSLGAFAKLAVRASLVPTHVPANLEQLNLLPANEAESEFLKCCGSKEWARQMSGSRPFASVDELIGRAVEIWWSLDPRDWLEAFHSHPKIGEKKAAQRVSDVSQAWSANEQSGVAHSAPDTLEALAELNRTYEDKFGFIFIVCATGKSSQEMLEILRERLENPPDSELRNAAAEQAKITDLRLRKLMSAPGLA